MGRDEAEDRPPRFITPAGMAAIRAEYEQLFATERPRLVETISWAAGNGDRSENCLLYTSPSPRDS